MKPLIATNNRRNRRCIKFHLSRRRPDSMPMALRLLLVQMRIKAGRCPRYLKRWGKWLSRK